MNPLVHVDILDELPDVLVDIMVVTILGQVNFLLFDGAHQSLGIAILGRLADLSHADLGLVLEQVNVVKSGILDALVGGTCLEGTGRPARLVPTSRVQVGRGRFVLRTDGGPVDLDRHTARGGPRFDQFERPVPAGVREQPRALADDHGEGEQVHLVDKVVVEQPPEQGAAAVHLQLASRLGFQLADGPATSPERTVVSAHRGSPSVVDATYLGCVFNAVQMGLSPGSAHDPQEPAKIS